MAENAAGSPLIDDLRRRLGDRYEIARELGRGGLAAIPTVAARAGAREG